MKIRRYISWLMVTGTLLPVTSCSDDSSDVKGTSDSLELIAVSKPFADAKPWTRAEFLPDGYVPYNVLYPTTTPDHTTIGVFMTPERASAVGNFIYQGTDGDGINIWKSTIAVTTGTDYFMYGFMPREDAESATISPLGDTSNAYGGYDVGATINLINFNTLTPSDVCVMVGARWASESEKINGLEAPLDLGKFIYTGHDQGDNRAFVIIKHIYAGLHFMAHIDPEYHKLRKIKLTKVELEAIDVPQSVNLSITVRANNTNTDPVESIVYDDSSSPLVNSTVQLFPYTNSLTEYEVPEVAIDFLGCFAPTKARDFMFKCHYNVYDSHDNLIREDCYAENRLNSVMIPNLQTLAAGEVQSIDFLIKPTYLYVLSDPDLDNPVFELTTTP